MLASITPLGQRGRGTSYPLTAAGLVLGGALGGAAAGAAAGAVGSLAGTRGAAVAPLVLASALGLGLALDLAGRLPSVHRQVNEDWLASYRGWVCGIGFGVQLGAGPATIVTSAAVYVALVAALLTGEPLAGAVIMGSFGAARGATALAAAGVREPAQLVALHSRLHRWQRPAARAALVAQALLLAGALAVALA